MIIVISFQTSFDQIDSGPLWGKPEFHNLPVEIKLYIFSMAVENLEDMVDLARVCRHWRVLVSWYTGYWRGHVLQVAREACPADVRHVITLFSQVLKAVELHAPLAFKDRVLCEQSKAVAQEFLESLIRKEVNFVERMDLVEFPCHEDAALVERVFDYAKVNQKLICLWIRHLVGVKQPVPPDSVEPEDDNDGNHLKSLRIVGYNKFIAYLLNKCPNLELVDLRVHFWWPPENETSNEC